MEPSSGANFASRVVLLEGNFRVWNRNKAADYKVLLTNLGLTLQPRGSPTSLSSSCCHLCSDQPRVEIFGRDIIAVRPAANPPNFSPKTAKAAKLKLGPPVFMLVTYPCWERGGTKQAYYFHYRPWSRSRQQDCDESDDEQEQQLRHMSDDLFTRVLIIKEDWVSTMKAVFFPQGGLWQPQNGARSILGTRGVNVSLAKSFLSQKLLVVLNPVAGEGEALKVFKEHVIPIFAEAGAQYEVLVTEHPGHAYEVMRGENLARWLGVVCVSGDGLLEEIFNGLFERSDWQDALSHLAVCTVPVGSRNAFSRSLVHCQGERFDGSGVVSGVLNAARCQVNPLDLMFVQTTRRTRVAVSGIGWGIINDIKSGKVKVKFLGQYSLGNMMNMLRLSGSSVKTYHAVLSYLPFTYNADSVRSPSAASSNSANDRNNNDVKKAAEVNLGSRSSSRSGKSSPSRKSKKSCSSCSSVSRSRSGTLAKERQRVPPKEMPLSDHSSLGSNFSGEAGERSLEALLPHSPAGSNQKSNSNRRSSKSRDSPHSPLSSLSPPVSLTSSMTNGGQKQPSSRYNYTSLLTEGQLYFRSWQELDVTLHHPGPFPLLNNHPTLMKPTQRSTSMPRSKEGEPKRPKPYFPLLPELHEPVRQEQGWVTEVGEFAAVHLLNQAAVDKSKVLVPQCMPDDGILWLLLVRGGISRKELVKFLERVERDLNAVDPDEEGEELGELPDGVEVIPVRGFRLSPLSPESNVTIDGEMLGPEEGSSVQAFIMPGVARTLVK